TAVAATTTYGETFCSGVEQDHVVGVQFHPEKSADVGRRVLERFFERLT
ncbi:MAG: glutamine amidotransferase-related protein, partial [Actinomycetota bacterium]